MASQRGLRNLKARQWDVKGTMSHIKECDGWQEGSEGQPKGIRASCGDEGLLDGYVSQERGLRTSQNCMKASKSCLTDSQRGPSAGQRGQM